MWWRAMVQWWFGVGVDVLGSLGTCENHVEARPCERDRWASVQWCNIRERRMRAKGGA
jgi:hypothetical protein